MRRYISPQPFTDYSPEEYHAYVNGMYHLRVKKGAKPSGPAPGLSVSKTKKGALSVRRAKKVRAFDYVTMPELAALAKEVPCSQADLWNTFKKKKYIIAKDRMEAEQIYAEIQQIPWGETT